MSKQKCKKCHDTGKVFIRGKYPVCCTCARGRWLDIKTSIDLAHYKISCFFAHISLDIKFAITEFFERRRR